VFIAYLFTIIDAFSSLHEVKDTFGLGSGVATDGISDGQGVGSVWLWLLPIVVGWLILKPKYQHDLNIKAFELANERCYGEKDGAYAIKTFCGTQLYADRQCSAPIFNYARLKSWAQDVDKVLDIYEEAFPKPDKRRPTSGTNGSPKVINPTAVTKATPHTTVEGDYPEKPQPTQGNTRPLPLAQDPEDQDTGHQGHSTRRPAGQNDHDCLKRFFLASLAGTLLQWGTAGGAIIIHYFTPTIGLGCRSLNWLLYAGASTTVWMLLVTSNHLTDTTDTQDVENGWTANLSIFIRVSAQCLAVCNAAAIVVSCMMQLGNFYNRCYCNSVVTHLGSRAFAVFWVRNVGDIVRPWVGGISLGIGSAVLFLLIIYLWLRRDPR